MKQIDKDRKELQRLVESYGKEDVLNYVRHLNESNYYNIASDINEMISVGEYAEDDDIVECLDAVQRGNQLELRIFSGTKNRKCSTGLTYIDINEFDNYLKALGVTEVALDGTILIPNNDDDFSNCSIKSYFIDIDDESEDYHKIEDNYDFDVYAWEDYLTPQGNHIYCINDGQEYR